MDTFLLIAIIINKWRDLWVVWLGGMKGVYQKKFENIN